jgi:putative membrane protein
MMGYGGAGWGGGFWMLGGLLLMIGVIVLVVWAASSVSRGGRPWQDSSRPTPNEIIRERFARGEITEQEFEQARKVLGPDR